MPFQESGHLLSGQIGASKLGLLNTGISEQNVMSSGNTINNNFNIVNNIMQINGEKPIPVS